MNIILDVNSIEIKNVSFLDSKKNIIVNGKFTRLMYSNSFLTMSGLYINFPINLQYINSGINDTNLFTNSRNMNNLIEDQSNELQSYKNIVFFNVNNPNNINIIKQICELEYKLLNYYKSEFLSLPSNNYKSFSLILSKQLSIGKLKLYKEINLVQSNNLFEENPKLQPILLSKNLSNSFSHSPSSIPPPPPGFSNINYLGFYDNSYGGLFESKNKISSQKKIYIVLKISGIWETKDEIGLTYKFLETSSI